MIKIIVLVILFYVVSKVIGLLFSGTTGKQENQVRGTSQTTPLDLSQEDVEDVDYKELPRKP